MKKLPLLSSLLSIVTALCVVLTGCGSQSKTDTSSSDGEFTWPQTMHFAGTGSSGEMKVLSWATIMQADLDGTIIRVVNEAAWTNTYKDMAQSNMILSQIDKSTMRDCTEALAEYASADGGPWMAGLVWVDSLANTGFMVRGDSSIYKPEDIMPGTRIAIWNNKSATMTPFLSLLAWAGVSQDDIVWVNTGDYDACARAVSEGRADLCMAAPVSQAVMEAAAAPGGIRYISLNPDDNPEGAAAFLEISPLYNFGPITVGPDSAIGTWGIVSYKYLASNIDTDEDLVYNMAKWLDENYDSYKYAYDSNVQMTLDDLVTVLQTTYLPVHPGLVKYLTEKGIWNEDYEARNQTNTAIFQLYIDIYQDAMDEAAAEGIEIKANNEKWIEYWENYKLEHRIPVIQMHVSLTQDAEPVMPKGYNAPAATTATAAPVTSTAPETTASEIEFEIVSISDAHPGDDVTVTIKTAPGAEVTILFTMPNGTASAYPKDNVKTAGEDGIITWTWNINSHVPAGEASYTFTIKMDGKESVVTETRTI
jgi:archaellin